MFDLNRKKRIEHTDYMSHVYSDVYDKVENRSVFAFGRQVIEQRIDRANCREVYTREPERSVEKIHWNFDFFDRVRTEELLQMIRRSPSW